MKKALSLFILAILLSGNAFALWNVGVIGSTKSSFAIGLSLDFTTGNLSSACAGVTGGCALTRASDGTYYDSSGVMQTATSNSARFDYNPSTLAFMGILIEPQVTNIAFPSVSGHSANWSEGNVSITANSSTSPDGNSQATLAIPSASDGAHFASIHDVPSSSSTPLTLSLFLKKKEYQYAGIDMYSGSFDQGALFNINSGSFISKRSDNFSNYGIIDMGNGWYRAWINFTPGTNQYGNLQFSIWPSLTGNWDGMGVGDGTSGAYMWAAQLEAGSGAPTSYIPATTASATRAADQLSFTIPSGITSLTYTFDDNSTQVVSVSAGSYTVPTNLNRPHIKTVVGN